MRWAMLGVGCALFLLCRRFFQEIFGSFERAFAATGTVLLMPITVLYTCHINPDGLTMLWVSIILFLSYHTLIQPLSYKRTALMGFVCGLIFLTKLSGAPALAIAFTSHWLVFQSKRQMATVDAGNAEQRPTPLKTYGLLVAIFLLTCGWWYVRAMVLYGTPFIHSGTFGTGLQTAGDRHVLELMGLVCRETYLSTWVQRGWFPDGIIGIVLYGGIIAINLAAAAGLYCYKSNTSLPSSEDCHCITNLMLLSALLILLVVLGHQLAFWTVDVGWLAGGRYIFVSMTAIALLLVFGLSQWPKASHALLAVWLIWIVTMNAVSAWNIDTVLNPRYAPNWKLFYFPPSEEP
jgi:4-amino-4-deoxy-L-arabinose transferase-like glycosyltransferase